MGPLGWLAIAVAGILVLVAAMWAAGAFDRDEGGTEAARSAHPLLDDPDVLAVEEVSQDPAAWEGRQVTLGGQVTHSEGPAFAFLESFEDPAQRVVLVSGADRPLGVFPGILPAQVTGAVTTFDLAAIESELGTTLDEGLYDDFEGMPALLVDDVHFFVNDPQAAGGALIEVVGWTVTLAGIVDEVHADGVFTLEGGDVVVLAGNAETPALEAEQRVEITGVVSLLDPAALSDAGVSAEVMDGLEGAPTITAETIQPLDDAS